MFMHQRFPSSLAPLIDTWIEYVYTVELDRETFSVNNGAHFKLDRLLDHLSNKSTAPSVSG